MEKEKIEIKFQPLSSGLGFHPFSDGLPYAPVSPTATPGTLKSNSKPVPNTALRADSPSYPPVAPKQGNTTPANAGTPMGLGATAAGAPTFVYPSRTPSTSVPKVNVPIAKAASQAVKKEEKEQKPLKAEQKFGFGYLLKRVLAYVLDSCINMGLAAASFCLALWNQNLQADLLFNSGVILVAGLFFFVFSWAIMTAQEIAFGTTLGKRIFGLGLRGSATAIFLRAFFFLPSLGFLGAGLLWGLFDRKRRCWHDLVVNLQPMDFNQL